MSFAFELMQDGGLEKPKPRTEGKYRPLVQFRNAPKTCILHKYHPELLAPIKKRWGCCEILSLNIGENLLLHIFLKNIQDNVFEHFDTLFFFSFLFLNFTESHPVMSNNIGDYKDCGPLLHTEHFIKLLYILRFVQTLQFRVQLFNMV